MPKRIFLTGASSGIGRATAELLAARGHHVWGTSRDPQRIRGDAGIHPVRLDLSEPGSIAPCFENAVREAGGFDVVINNAGSGHFGPAEFLMPEIMRAQIQTLLFAQVEICQLALSSMRSRGSGLIINVTSLASRLPVPFMGAYNAAKAAMASFTTTLQLELEGSAIRVIDLQPGDIRTNFNDVIERTPDRSSYAARVEKAWKVVDKNMRHAPEPALVARRVVALIEQGNPPPRVTIGDRFQTLLAPAIFALLTPRMRVRSLRSYYKI
ncbi:MAG: SDR family NAD(P)-dependent oxidoreductase [Verrucomicrobiota bacterium]|nr:SDR family NAD(P)-dependent oxidoreductase [Verrucomicrobiota bacterium]